MSISTPAIPVNPREEIENLFAPEKFTHPDLQQTKAQEMAVLEASPARNALFAQLLSAPNARHEITTNLLFFLALAKKKGFDQTLTDGSVNYACNVLLKRAESNNGDKDFFDELEKLVGEFLLLAEMKKSNLPEENLDYAPRLEAAELMTGVTLDRTDPSPEIITTLTTALGAIRRIQALIVTHGSLEERQAALEQREQAVDRKSQEVANLEQRLQQFEAELTTREDELKANIEELREAQESLTAEKDNIMKRVSDAVAAQQSAEDQARVAQEKSTELSERLQNNMSAVQTLREANDQLEASLSQALSAASAAEDGLKNAITMMLERDKRAELMTADEVLKAAQALEAQVIGSKPLPETVKKPLFQAVQEAVIEKLKVEDGAEHSILTNIIHAHIADAEFGRTDYANDELDGLAEDVIQAYQRSMGEYDIG